jgi:hypothetical protein
MEFARIVTLLAKIVMALLLRIASPVFLLNFFIMDNVFKIVLKIVTFIMENVLNVIKVAKLVLALI